MDMDKIATIMEWKYFVTENPSATNIEIMFWGMLMQNSWKQLWQTTKSRLEKLRGDRQEVREQVDSKRDMKVHLFLGHKSLNDSETTVVVMLPILVNHLRVKRGTS